MQNEKLNNKDYSASLKKELNELSAKPIPPIDSTPDNPSWNSWAAFGVWIASVLFIVVLGNLFVLPYLMSQSLDFTNQAAIVEFAKNDPTAVLLQVVATIPAHLLTLALCWALITRFNKSPFWKTLGWQSGGFVWWHYAVILAGISAVAYTVSYFVPEQDNEVLRMLRTSHAVVYAFAFLATFTAPLVEEVVYRGILYPAFQRSFGIAPAVFFVTLVFAAVHFYQYWGSPSTLFLICFLSLVLTLVRVRAKNLLPCFILHTLINGIQSILLVIQTFLPAEATGAPNQIGSAVQFFNHIFC